jgi:nucleoside-diphosphate-sugar epimerase
VPKRDGDIRGTPADISRAKTLMGWEPAVDWEAAVSRTVSWFSERLAVDSIVAAS